MLKTEVSVTKTSESQCHVFFYNTYITTQQETRQGTPFLVKIENPKDLSNSFCQTSFNANVTVVSFLILFCMELRYIRTFLFLALSGLNQLGLIEH